MIRQHGGPARAQKLDPKNQPERMPVSLGIIKKTQADLTVVEFLQSKTAREVSRLTANPCAGRRSLKRSQWGLADQATRSIQQTDFTLKVELNHSKREDTRWNLQPPCALKVLPLIWRRS